MSINARVQLFIAGVVGIVFRGYNLSWLHLRSGDFAAFLAGEIARVGGRLRSTDAPPPFRAQWLHQSDDEGFMIGLPEAEFSQIASVLQERFGPTVITPMVSAGQEGRYHRKDVGLDLVFFSPGGSVTIMCTKGRR